MSRPDHDALFLAKQRTSHRDCAFCRHSETRALEGKHFGFVCGKEHPVMDAPSCADLKDSRRASVGNDG